MKTPNQPLVPPAFLESSRSRPGRARAAAFTFTALLAIAGQGAAADAASSAEALQVVGGLGDPTEDDPILKFAKENNFDAIFFAVDCSSVSDGGQTLDGEGVSALPVGGGRRLECTIDVAPQVAKFVIASDDEPWCLLGQQTGFKTVALDNRLGVTVESAPSVGPWSVVATRAGGEITVIRASGSWPLAVQTNNAPVDLQPALGRTCEQVFGL
jgi:hypothetical protein